MKWTVISKFIWIHPAIIARRKCYRRNGDTGTICLSKIVSVSRRGLYLILRSCQAKNWSVSRKNVEIFETNFFHLVSFHYVLFCNNSVNDAIHKEGNDQEQWCNPKVVFLSLCSERTIHCSLWTKYIYMLHGNFKHSPWICFGW